MKKNPYIGPQPYTREDQHNFYGRTREARDLQAKMMAERVVLFYAQSGAGKSSLLNAKVIPGLEEQGFYILPVARVGGEIPPGFAPAAIRNVFIMSLLQTLAGEAVPPEVLVAHTLASYLEAQYPHDAAKPPPLLLLIVDQFEELFTTHRDRWQDARDFFVQVSEALEAVPSLGILFTMREEHIASLDPYTALLPRRLRARFRMERLGPEGALEAIVKPALHIGVHYDEGVAAQIVDNLRRVQVQQTRENRDLAEVASLGPYVEPVQLQVVCHQLWENLPDQEDYTIQWSEVEAYGNIDRALTSFYEHAVTTAVEATGVREREIRTWFNEHLITPMETRGLVLRGLDETAGLPNAVMDVLERRYVIRAEARAGGRWYEISHDRLVAPILSSNRAWAAARETPLRATSRQWAQNEDASLLYRSAALEQALAWAKANPEELEPYEEAFLEASQEAAIARQRVQRRQRVTMAALTLGLIVMTALSIYAFMQRRIARRMARAALVGELSGQAHAHWDDTGLGMIYSLLLARESMNYASSIEAQQALVRGLRLFAPSVLKVQHEAAVHAVAFSPDGRYVASGSADHTLQLWDLAAQTLRAQVQHDGPITALTFSPGGQWLVSGSEDGTARVWDVGTMAASEDGTLLEVARMQPSAMSHARDVSAVTFSPDGRWVASARLDGTLQILAVGSWQEIARLQNDVKSANDIPAPIRTMAFSYNGEWLASGSDDAKVRVWGVQARRQAAVLEHEEGEIQDVTFGDHDARLVSSGADDLVRVWDTTTWQQITQITYHKDVWQIDVSPDGQYLVAGGEEGLVQVWDMVSGKLISTMQHEGVVLAVKFSPDGQWVASAGGDALLRVWHVATGQEMTRGVHQDAVYDVAFSPDGRWIASASKDSTMQVWGLEDRDMLWFETRDEVWDLAFSPSGDKLISGDDDDTAQVWDVRTGKALVQVNHEDDVRVVRLSPAEDGRWAATASYDGVIQIWEVASGQVVARMQHDDRVRDVAFSPDGQYVVSGSEDYTVRIWETATGQELMRMHHRGGVKDVAFSPDGQWVASSSADGTARIWDAHTGQEIWQMSHAEEIWAIAFSPDGRWFATGGNDQKVRVWDTQTGDKLTEMSYVGWMDAITFSSDGRWLAFGGGEFDRWGIGSGDVQVWETGSWDLVLRERTKGWVRSLAFTSDSRWLAAGGFDGEVRIWDTLDATLVAQIKHKPRIYVVAFSPDDRWIASGGMDKNVRLWLWRPQDLARVACERLPRNFTPEEWENYLSRQDYHPTCPNLPLPQE